MEAMGSKLTRLLLVGETDESVQLKAVEVAFLSGRDLSLIRISASVFSAPGACRLAAGK
jgi:hypothetical protein